MPLSLHGGAATSSLDTRRVGSDTPIFARPEQPAATVPEAIARHHRVRMFRGGSTKDAAYPNRGKPMREFPFVQINPRDYVNFLVVDVDREDAEMLLLHPAVPEPHWIIQNPANGHAQAGWMIHPVYRGPDAREHPIRYAQSVQTALARLTESDEAFTGFLVRNPAAHSPAGVVRFSSRHDPYSLGELMKHMQEYQDPFDDEFQAWAPHRDFRQSRSVTRAAEETGRNNALFYATRAQLWSRYGSTGLPPSNAYALEYATSLNSQLPSPLPTREIRELAASAVRQVMRGKGQNTGGAPDKWLSRMGRLGGSATTDAKRLAAARNVRKATQTRQSRAEEDARFAVNLRTLGHSLAQIAQALGKTVRTVQRYLAKVTGPCDISQATGSHGTGVDPAEPKVASSGEMEPTGTVATRPSLRTAALPPWHGLDRLEIARMFWPAAGVLRIWAGVDEPIPPG